MQASRRFTRALMGILPAGLLVLAWLNLAPAQFGGLATYVIPSGISMEPGIQRGDLVILHPAAEYRVGDVVTYRDPRIGRILHRIVGRDGDRFIFKGDHNGWLDSYHPGEAELIGRLWLYVPGAGKLLDRLHTPPMMAALVIVTVAAGLLPAVKRRPRRGRRAGRMASKGGQMSAINSSRMQVGDWLFVLGALILGAGVLGALVFTRPLTVPSSDDLAYQHTGAFTYTADAPPGVYDGDIVRTGEPIFRRLITKIDVSFAYRLDSQYPPEVRGTLRLDAELSNSSGWHSTLPLAPVTSFAGPASAARAELDLSRIQALIDGVEAQTGVSSGGYTLAIVPTVAVSGTLAGQPLQDEFAPHLAFRLDALQMALEGSASGASEAGDPLQPVKSATLARSRQVPNTLPLLGASLPVRAGRAAAVLGLVVGLAGLVALGLYARRCGQPGEAGAIEARYGSLLLNVVDTNAPTPGRLVEVATIDDLARIAARLETLILHSAGDSMHAYTVLDHDVAYRYQTGRYQPDRYQAGGTVAVPRLNGVGDRS